METQLIGLSIAAKRWLYIGLSLLVVLIAIVGFWPTYFGPLLSGTVNKVPVIHFHAAVYSGWLFLFVTQVVLASTGRLALHRKLGKVGIGYGVVIIVVGVFTAFSLFFDRVEAGRLEEAQRALLGPLTDMIVFPIFFGAALLYRRKPDFHKRFMLVATTCLLIAAIGRMTFLDRNMQYLVWFSPILLAMAYDFFSRRLIHPAYIFGLIGLFTLRQRNYLLETDMWLDVSRWMATLVS